MQDMASEENPGARSRSLKRKASGAKPAPALESLPTSGDEDDGLEFVQQGRKFVIQRDREPVPSKGRAQKASDRPTAAHAAAKKRKNEIKSLVNRGIHDPSAAFIPPRIDRNDKKALAEASSMMHDLLELMRNERRLFSKGKISSYFTSAKDYSQALKTLLPIVKFEVEEDTKQVKDAQRKRKASEVDGDDELEGKEHASEPVKSIKTPEDALRILEQTEDIEKLKVIRDHLGSLSLSLNPEIDERVEQRSDPCNAGEYHILDDDLYALDFVQESLEMLRTIVKNKIDTLGEEKGAEEKAALGTAESQES